MMKKCISALQEFLESSSKEGYPDPECSQEVSGNSTGKLSLRLDLKLSRWRKLFRTQRPSLQTTACLKPGWGQTTRRRYSSLSTRSVFHLQTQFISPFSYSPILPFSPASPPRPLLPSTSTFSTSLFSFPSPFPRWKKSYGSPADKGRNTWEMMGARRGKEEAVFYRCWNKVKLAEGWFQNKSPR